MEEMIGHDLSKTSGRTAFTAAKNGDKVGAEVVDDYIDYLACGLTNVVRIFHPDVLSIGGGIANERDNLLIPLRERVTEMMHMPEGFKLPELKIAEMGNDAGIIGAATLGM